MSKVSAMNWWVARTRRGNVAPTVHASTRWGNDMRRSIIAAALTTAAIAVLGLGTAQTASAAAGPGPSTVGTGYSHTCAVRTGGMWCWGGNESGQLGDGTTAGHTAPARVGDATTWSRLDAGTSYNCAVRTDGTLWCW